MGHNAYGFTADSSRPFVPLVPGARTRVAYAQAIVGSAVAVRCPHEGVVAEARWPEGRAFGAVLEGMGWRLTGSMTGHMDDGEMIMAQVGRTEVE